MSLSKSLGQFNETKPEKSLLKRSASYRSDNGRSRIGEAMPMIENFLKSNTTTRRQEEQTLGDIDSKNSIRTKIEKKSTPMLNEIARNITLETEVSQNSLGTPESRNLRSDEEFQEEEVDLLENNYEVRKDSALYIDLVTDSENLRPLKSRARRESSGYFSNFGTFEEDRWPTGTMDLSNQQEQGMGRNTTRERRRSSTKNRLPVIASEHQIPIQETIVSSLSDNLTTDSKLASSSEIASIEEQKSFELDASLHRGEPINDGKYEDQSQKISRMSLGSSPNDEEIVDDATMRKNEVGEAGEAGRRLLDGRMNAMSQQRDQRACERQMRGIISCRCGSSSIPSTDLESIIEKPIGEMADGKDRLSENEEGNEVDSKLIHSIDDDSDEKNAAKLKSTRNRFSHQADPLKTSFPRSVKIYQLLSTRSEDRGDDESRIFERRISLQTTKLDDKDEIGSDEISCSTQQRSKHDCFTGNDKRLVHADSMSIIKLSCSSDFTNAITDSDSGVIVGTNRIRRNLPIESEELINRSTDFRDKSAGPTITGNRPIYPYCPYSPYASPQGSPKTHRRRPLRESRRVSIDSRQGELQLNQYKLLNDIGQGSYGIVKLAYNEEDDTHYAMKILSKKKLMKKAGIFGRIAPGRRVSANPLAKVYREIALLKKLDHPNVVKLVEVLDDPDEDNLYLVFELVERGEVLELPTDNPLGEETARRYFRDVVKGVEYLHYQRIVHRDIKPSNLLVDSDGRVKVADLGVSAELRAAGELLSGPAGTPAFAAPETTTPGAQYSGTLCDIWSMGVTLYSLVIGKVPWNGAGSITGVQAAVRSENLRFPEKPEITEDLCDLITRMLIKDPLKRMTLAEIKEHRWLINNGLEPFPTEAENCRLPVTVTDEEVARVVTRVPKLDTLILIKTMLKQHSFQNPFISKKIVKSSAATDKSRKQQAPNDIIDPSMTSFKTAEITRRKTDRFHESGRSNSAPDNYEWQMNGRSTSCELSLPPVTESSNQGVES